ncbi:MAG: hypothetical protein J7604_01945 [Sporocytophaga sp.]|uniref:hypothetical protein n=1 Tax=Sporocytophaga sp. TaxID=2231183 RepID=UPI001B049EE8|nr:hypothetical protein [Sporocytophaga sp.]MBO9698937.1 hypothetical protein [Sporocytophaga sp.]
MKKYLAIALSFLLLLNCFMKLIILADFHINRQYIASHYCMNRNIKGSDCKGHCYLNKSLNQEKKDSKSPVAKTKITEESFECISFNLFNCIKKVSQKPRLIYQEDFLQSFPDKIFRPPKISLV